MMFSTDFLGFSLKNPLMLTEGPMSGTEKLIMDALAEEVGLIFTKGIRPEPITSPVPFMNLYRRSLMNADWSCIGIDAWEIVFRNMDSRFPLVASIAKNYVSPQTALDMAVRMERAGAGIISFVDYDPYALIETVKMARPVLKVPIMVKLPPFLPRLEENLAALVNAGVDAIAAMDSIGPVLSIDIETGEPVLGSADGSGYLSGESILPVTLKYIYEISRFVDVPVVGVGGVTSGDSALQMIMAGATGVGMVSHPMRNGLGVFGRVLGEIETFLNRKNIEHLDEIRGRLRRINEDRKISSGFRARIDSELCINCGLCMKICYSGAVLAGEKSHSIDQEKCTGCGLCSGVCKPGAIEYV